MYACYSFFKGTYQSTTTNHNKHENPMIVKTHHNPRPRRIGACESVATSHYFRVEKALLINEKNVFPLQVTSDAVIDSTNNISSKGNTAN